jgi:hypothetical protein
MNIKSAYGALVLGLCSLLMGYDTIKRPESLDGTWIRKGDNIKIEIDKSDASNFQE